ncbi:MULTISPECIES: GNAT family N-acetyltransferase [unclassified Streptomyces]|uniref:GNAT family N-acetyltransferase n=1 Tax=unclassified Streptomyces TaxID=2593676 RepID=UPI00339FE7F2
MDVTVLRPDELTAADLGAWGAMQRADLALANPFLASEFARAVGHRRAAARVARLSEGGLTVGFFPFERHRLGSGKPIGSGFCDCQGLIHRPGLDWDAAALLKACGLALWEYDHLTVGQAPFEIAGTPRARVASPVMELNGGHRAYLERLRHKVVRAARAQERRLTQDAGPLRLEFHTPDPVLLDTLILWKSDQQRSKGRRNILSHAWFLAILRELFDLPSESCSGTLSVLRAGGTPVAMLYGLRSKEVYATWFPTYDTRFAKYSPGILLHLKLAEAAAERGVTHIDMGKGTSRYKDALKTTDLSVTEGYVGRHTPGAMLCRLRMASDRTAHEAINANPRVHRAVVRAVDALDRLR